MRQIVILLFFLPITLFGQTTSHKVDTVNVYKNKTGVRYGIYLRNWFFDYGLRNSYSWNPGKLNKQDSLVIEPHPPRYFKVYNSKNRLLFEGQTGLSGTGFEGDVKYYYKTGELKRIEHWGYKQHNDSCKNISIGFNDGPGREGTWKYFRKDGTLKKQYDYIIKIYSCEPLNYAIIRQITKFKKNGKIKSIKQKNVR